MRSALTRPFATVLFLIIISSSSCLVRRRVVTRQGKQDTKPLATASLAELIDRVRLVYDPIKSFNATFDMTPSLGSVYKGEIDEFPSVRGFVIFRKPNDIRIIGLDPVIHSRAFDMVSVGNEFRLSIPSKNRFIEGRNDAPTNSTNKLENLRPAAFLHSMLIMPPEPDETALLEDDTDEEHAFYILLVLRKEPLQLDRAIYLDRVTFQIVRQKAFDPKGLTVSDTRYSDWKLYDGLWFPGTMDINRPADGYGVVMKLITITINPDITADKFVLDQPPGSQLQQIGAPPSQ